MNSRKKLRADIYLIKSFMGNGKKESGPCRGPGDRLVGDPVLHCEPLKSSGHDCCTQFGFRCLTAWPGEDYQSITQDVQTCVRFVMREAMWDMVWSRGIVDNEGVKGA